MIAVVVGVVSFSILVVNIVYVPISVWNEIKLRKRRRKLQEQIAREVEASPETEKAILAYLITSGRRTFSANFNDQGLSPLVSKGFLVKRDGFNDMRAWPYIVPQEVWDYLDKNKESYHFEISDDGHDPFHSEYSPW